MRVGARSPRHSPELGGSWSARGGARSLAAVYEQQVRLLRTELPALATQVEAEVEAEAPAAVASLFAGAITRWLRSRTK